MSDVTITPQDIDTFLTDLALVIEHVNNAILTTDAALAEEALAVAPVAATTAPAAPPASLTRQPGTARRAIHRPPAPDVSADSPVLLNEAVPEPEIELFLERTVPKFYYDRVPADERNSHLLMMTGGLDLSPAEIRLIFSQVYARFSNKFLSFLVRAPPPPPQPPTGRVRGGDQWTQRPAPVNSSRPTVPSWPKSRQ